MQIENLDLAFDYCKPCLPTLFDKIFVIASKLVNLQWINFQNDWQIPHWFLLHFIYGVIQSQLKYHKCIKLKNIQCCQINDDNVDMDIDSRLPSGIDSIITKNIAEYKKILPKLLTPCLEKVAISCSKIALVPPSLFGNCNKLILPLKSQSSLKELTINLVVNDGDHKQKFNVWDLVDQAVNNVNFSQLETIIIRAQSDLQIAQRSMKAVKKYTNLRRETKIIIDWECGVYDWLVLDKYGGEKILGFEKQYIPFFDALFELIQSSINHNCNDIECRLMFT